MYTAPIFGFGGFAIFLVSILIVSVIMQVTAEQPLKCLLFSDGKLAVIQITGKYDTYCFETVSWFIDKGYSITGIGADSGNFDYQVYMER